jgi:hypothetical protein
MYEGPTEIADKEILNGANLSEFNQFQYAFSCNSARERAHRW